MVHTGIKVNVFHDPVIEFTQLHVNGHATVASPVIRRCAPSMGNDELQRGKVCEDIRHHQLNKCRCVAIDVMGSHCIEMGIARSTHVNHHGYIVFNKFFVQGIPPIFIGQWRICPHPARGIGIQIGANKTQLIDAPVEFIKYGFSRFDTRDLRQLANTHEMLRKHLAYAVNQVIAVPCPDHICFFVSELMIHTYCSGRENGEIDASFIHHLQLAIGDG